MGRAAPPGSPPLHLCHGRGYPPCPQPEPLAPPHAHRAPSRQAEPRAAGKLMSRPMTMFPAACPSEFPSCPGLADVAERCRVGCGYPSSGLGTGEHCCQPWDRAGSPSATSRRGSGHARHPCAPLAWAPMETPPLPQPAGGQVPPCPRVPTPLLAPNPPPGCQAGGHQGCARGFLAPLGCQSAPHSLPIPPVPQRGQTPPSPRCAGWEGTLGMPMGHCQPPEGGRSGGSTATRHPG